MKIGGQRILSLEFLIAALGLFVVMLLLPILRNGDDLGWEVWVWFQIILDDPRSLGEWPNGLVFSSYFTLSLLIVVSPFLGNVLAKSLLVWSIVVFLSAVATVCYFLSVSSEWAKWSVVGWFMVIASVLNFVGLLLARPQWLKKSGPAEFQKPP